MKRARVATGLAVAVLAAVAWTSGSASARPAHGAAARANTPVTLTFWSDYTTKRELGIFNASFSAFHKAYPWITVKSTGGMNDDKILAAITSGTPPDALLSFLPDNVGKFCTTGAWTNLNSYIQKDHLSLSVFPRAALTFSGFKGDQCSLPALADSYGLYYNTDMLRAKGIAHPPRTLSELAADAKKLTVFNPDGSIKVAGFVPFGNFYENSVTGGLVQAYGAKWFDAHGKANLAADPRWAQLLQWEKKLIDWYGYGKLQRFVAGKGDEFSTSNDFETGKVAMVYDGEWRTAFIAGDKAKVHYGTAPFPAADSAPGQWGSGFISGNLVAIPKGSKHANEAWLLIKFLATNTPNMVRLSNGLGNVPTTAASAGSSGLKPNKKFATFIKIFNNPQNTTMPITPVGSAFGTLLNNFIDSYQAGHVKDLAGGLAKVDKDTDAQLKQGGGVP